MRRIPKEPRKRLDQDTEELPEPGRRFSGSARNYQLAVGQLREVCSWAQGTKKDMSISRLQLKRKDFGNS